MMRIVHAVVGAGNWPTDQAVAWVTLGCDDRQRRRLAMADDAGVPFLLDLPRLTVLHDGDGLLIDGGGVIGVRAAAEAVADVHASSPMEMARLAWHLGNRHTAIQLLPGGRIRIRDDAVLVAMLEGWGARIARRLAPFEPETGAYGHSGSLPPHPHGSGDDDDKR